MPPSRGSSQPFPTQGSNPRLLRFLHWQADSSLCYLGSPIPHYGLYLFIHLAPICWWPTRCRSLCHSTRTQWWMRKTRGSLPLWTFRRQQKLQNYKKGGYRNSLAQIPLKLQIKVGMFWLDWFFFFFMKAFILINEYPLIVKNKIFFWNKHETIKKINITYSSTQGLPRSLSGKYSTCRCRRLRKLGFDSWVWKIPRRREWLPTPVFLPGKFHGERNLASYSPWGHKELNTTEWLNHHSKTPTDHILSLK